MDIFSTILRDMKDTSDEEEEEEEATITTLREKLMAEKAALQPKRDVGFKFILEAIKSHIANQIRECILGQEDNMPCRFVFLAPDKVVYDTLLHSATLYTAGGGLTTTIIVPLLARLMVAPSEVENLNYIRTHVFSLRQHMDTILTDFADNGFAVTFEKDENNNKQICVSW